MSKTRLHRESYGDNSSPSDDDSRGMRDLPLAVARDARVVSNVLVPDVADAKFGAVVEYANGARGLHRVRVLVPQDLGSGRALRLAVKDDGIS